MNVKRKYQALVVLGLGGLVMASTTAAGAAPAKTPTGTRTPVIVVLRNQHQELPARTANAQRRLTTQNEQAPLVDRAVAGGATKVKRFSVVNGFSATMSDAQIAQLQADPNVAAVVPDRLTRIHPLSATEKATVKAQAAAAPADHVIPGTCPTDPAKPLLEPEALQTTQTEFLDQNRPQAHKLATGKGVKVAWIADGLDPNNPDFIRADGTPVFTDYQDFSGTDPNAGGGGGEAFGDASSIAAQGRQVYDLSKFVNSAHPLPAGCNIRVKGIAPDASLVGINVFGSSDFVINSLIIQAIDYAVTTDNVDVINESFGGNAYPTDGVDPVALADDAAVAAGVTVVASTGDAGPFNTVGSPAVDPNVISAGAVTNFRVQAQTGYAGTRNFATSWVSDNAAPISSDGTTARGRVPDLVAPGQDGWAICTPDPVKFANCTDFNNGGPSPIEDFGGTSESSPFIAGGAALVIEAYKNAHGGAKPSPALVKQILTSSATDLGLPATQQGSGELNTLRAVQLAMSVKDGNGRPQPRGDTLMVTAGNGDTQLTATGNPGARQDIPVKVTNNGGFTQVLSAHGRVLDATLSDLTASIPLDVTSANSPSFLDGIGTPAGPVLRRFNQTTFRVPAGADHLTGVLSWPGGGANGQSSVRLALIGPNGEYETHSLPQGAGNHGQVDIRFPAPGTWTAVFFASASPTGFHGNVQYRFTTSRYTNFGDVSPRSLTLRPGETGTFHVHTRMPDAAGDLSAAVEIDNQFRGKTSIPLTLRTLLSTSNDGGAFTGEITGGNGRGTIGEQTLTYVFDVPKGKRDLGVDLTLQGDPNQPLYAALLSPDHQVLSLQTNNNTTTIQGYVRDPAPGRWLLFLNVNNPVSGTSLAEKFTGHLRYNAVDVKAAGVPSGTVPAGKPIAVTLTVRNTGVAPASFFADPRSTELADYDLVTQLGTSATASIPFDVTQLGPSWLVPTETRTLSIEQSATVPADFDASTLINQIPEVYGAPQGLTALATVSANRVSQGLWTAAPTALGPTNGPVTGTATYTATVHTKAFDSTATTSTGDAWLFATHADTSFTPLVLQPGQTGTITVTITPTGAAGTKVGGVLYVDTFSTAVLSGDELTAIPYSYTIG